MMTAFQARGSKKVKGVRYGPSRDRQLVQGFYSIAETAKANALSGKTYQAFEKPGKLVSKGIGIGWLLLSSITALERINKWLSD